MTDTPTQERALRLGHREKEVLGACDLDGWRTPFGILQAYPAVQITSLLAKGLIEIKWRAMTPEDNRATEQLSDFDAFRYRCRTRLTPAGLKIAAPLIEQRKSQDAALKALQADSDYPFIWTSNPDDIPF